VNDKFEQRRRLGKIFEDLLEEWKETQAGLAKLARVNPSMISQAKSGKKWFYMNTVEDIARVMGIPSEYFNLADERLTVAENKKIVNLLMELRNSLITAALAQR